MLENSELELYQTFNFAKVNDLDELNDFISHSTLIPNTTLLRLECINYKRETIKIATVPDNITKSVRGDEIRKLMLDLDNTNFENTII